ncbi:hypothetical protein L3Q82_001272 [Scortum barcoo]|uniref:Uncharacterized protein n=1 Tax=Scortum barcoo TaxID=214431 RepID=A0ACB8W7J8_9TELE|nr:hypothetical protein L3Q82_001272 [Scortum barcoo]
MEGGEGESGRKRGARGGRRALEVDEGRAGGGAGGRRADSTACTAAAAVIGSHHSSAIFPVSPPIYPHCLRACRFSSEGESEQQKERLRRRGERDREQLGQDLQHVLERFAAECEAAGMRISTSKSEAMVLDRKRVVCPLRVSGEVLPQVEEFKYLGVLFTSEGKMEREIDRRIGAASAVMRSVYRTVVVKKELSRKAKLSIYRSIYAPTLTYGHELWVMTERTRSLDTSGRNEFPPQGGWALP